jgi:hypothetical protein
MTRNAEVSGMDIARFSPIDDDQPEFNPEEFQAGYDARQRAAWATSATRSWRAGWVDADASIVTDANIDQTHAEVR